MRCAWPAIHSSRAGAAVVAAALWAACSEPRPAQIGQGNEDCPTYEVDVQPLLVESCAGCHGSTDAQGGYRVDSYPSTIARRPDGTTRFSSDDLNGLGLKAARGETSVHTPLTTDKVALLERWVRCDVPPRSYLFHEEGWMDPSNAAAFHGRVLRSLVYDDSTCRDCHGADLSGGTAGIACSSCHAQPTDSCGTCHGSAANAAPPRDLDDLSDPARLGVGAHQVHVNAGPLHAGYRCEACHPTPVSPGDEGHYQKGGALDEPPADVVLRQGAGAGAAWNRDEARCNGYCHAPVADTNASEQHPTWTGLGQGAGLCGTCHGLPPSTHAANQTACSVCHRPAFRLGTLWPELHANGVVDLSAPEGSCVGCHGKGEDPAPPVDLNGDDRESARGVGAHQAHLHSKHHLSAPVKCGECHRVPATVDEPTHIDGFGPAELFPDATVGTLARARGAAPDYEPTDGTCGAYCHGGGGTLVNDAAASNQRPMWTAGVSQAGCGTCHGVPPATPSHPTGGGLSSCVRCHGETVNAGGAIIVNVDPGSGEITSKHIDGQVQAVFP
jgi:predicted CxxxxCH...CXXCH cytochrome family protein